MPDQAITGASDQTIPSEEFFPQQASVDAPPVAGDLLSLPASIFLGY